MRRLIVGILLGGLVAFGSAAGAGAEEVVKDTLMLRAKDTLARTVNIGGELFHVTSTTKIVGARGKAMKLTAIAVPDVRGAVPPKGEPGVRVKYAAIVKAGRKDLVSLEVQGKGSRSH